MADSTNRAEPSSIFSNKSRHVAALLQVFVYVWALFGKSKHGRLQFGDQRRSRSGSFISTVKLFLFLPTALTTSWKSFFSLRTSPFPFRSNTKWKDVKRGRCFTLFVFLAWIEEKTKTPVHVSFHVFFEQLMQRCRLSPGLFVFLAFRRQNMISPGWICLPGISCRLSRGVYQQRDETRSE